MGTAELLLGGILSLGACLGVFWLTLMVCRWIRADIRADLERIGELHARLRGGGDGR